MTDLSKLCIHTITTKPLGIYDAVEKYSALGVKGITVWRDVFEKHKPIVVREIIDAHNLEIVSLCRGGFFPSIIKKSRDKAIIDNLKAIEESALLGAPLLVLVPGADPQQPLEVSRQQIKEGIAAILPYAQAAGVKLAIEPLHPLYADTRSAINTMKQANDIADYFNSPWLGVAVDVYHVWWDPDLEREIVRCGKNNKLFAFHICDWKTPTTDLLFDRGIMGEGCIDISYILGLVKEAGFNGFNEVEIFSNIWWNSDQDEYLRKIVNAYMQIG